MRRWLRRAFCLLCFAVLLLGVGVWVRSYFVTADIEWFSRYTERALPQPTTFTLGIGVGWGPGMIGLFHYRGESSTPVDTARTWIYREFGPNRRLTTDASPDDRLNLRLGNLQLLYRLESKPDGWLSLRLLVFPAWFTLAAAVPPVVCWMRRRGGSRG